MAIDSRQQCTTTDFLPRISLLQKTHGTYSALYERLVSNFRHVPCRGSPARLLSFIQRERNLIHVEIPRIHIHPNTHLSLPDISSRCHTPAIDPFVVAEKKTGFCLLRTQERVHCRPRSCRRIRARAGSRAAERVKERLCVGSIHYFTISCLFAAFDRFTLRVLFSV